LLPRITPIIAVWWQEPEGDPLAGYFDFLGTLGHIAKDVLVLPAHNRPYRELRTRVADLADHHVERLDITLDTCAALATSSMRAELKPASANTLSAAMTISPGRSSLRRCRLGWGSGGCVLIMTLRSLV